MEMKIQLSTAKDWFWGSKASSSNVEEQNSCEKGKNPLMGFEALSSKKGSKKSRDSFLGDKSCFGDSSKAKAVISCSEIDELNDRVKALEEETEMMKEALFWSLKERKVMVNEIYKLFKSLHLSGCFQSRDQDWRVLPEILSSDQNPTLITKELRVGALTFQELAGYKEQVKCHHD